MTTLSALLGFVSVAFAAFAEHGLKPNLAPNEFDSLSVAIHSHQLHAIVLLIVSFALRSVSDVREQYLLKISGALFTAGIVLFSGSIYFAYTTSLPFLKKAAPTGGVLLMLGWIVLAVSGLRYRDVQKRK